MRVVARLALIGALFVPAVVALESAPAAGACNVAQQIFTFPFNGVFGAAVGSAGQGRFLRAHNTVDASCSSTSWQSLNTVNFLWDDASAYYYEVGYQELNTPGTTSGTHRLRAFIEHHLNASVLEYIVYGNPGEPGPPCGGGVMETDGGILNFRIVTDGAGSWTARINCHDGVGWRTLRTVQALAQTGVSRGEWERRSTLVSTITRQDELQWLNPNTGNWVDWAAVLCWGDTLPNYRWNPYAANAWNIASGSAC